MKRQINAILEQEVSKKKRLLDAEEQLWENLKKGDGYVQSRCWEFNVYIDLEANRRSLSKFHEHYFRSGILKRMNLKASSIVLGKDQMNTIRQKKWTLHGFKTEDLSLSSWGNGLRYTLCKRALQHKSFTVNNVEQGNQLIHFVDKVFWYLGGNVLEEWKEWIMEED